MAAKHVLAVDLGGTKLAMALVNRAGKLLMRKSVGVDTSSPLAPVEQIVSMAHDLVGRKKLKAMLAAAGVAVPGLVRRDGTVWAPNLPGWTKMPLARRLKSALGIPVLVESDRNAAVLGETWSGAARKSAPGIRERLRRLSFRPPPARGTPAARPLRGLPAAAPGAKVPIVSFRSVHA